MTTDTVIALFRNLEEGHRAIAATRRLARQVEQHYAVWKTAAGVGVWPTPGIRVYDDWLSEIWQAVFEHRSRAPRLLTADQELLLWEQVIRRHAEADGAQALLQLAGTARAARRTWARIHEWQLDWRGMRRYRDADTEAFMDWAAAFHRILAERSWLTSAQLPGYLVAHGPEWLPAQGRPASWLGFDTMPPATRAVMALLDEHGCPQTRFSGAGIGDAETRVVECRDSEDQWRRIARWARSELTTNPRITLGVVCPDLHRRRDEIEEILEDILHPELPWRVDAPRVFHLSLGRPLSAYPITGAALDVLHWTGRRIPFEIVSRTLRSPYLGSGDDRDARVELEVALRRRGEESFSISFLETLAGDHEGLAELSRILGAARGLDPPERADPASWSAYFSDWLRTFAWPGGKPLDSHEHQALNAWREQLSRFAGLNAVQDRWTLSDALRKLSAMTAARVLQFHDDQAPLQIMGAAESAGLWFDKLWLADMSDAVWPPPAQPDPFIPVSLQKASGMPESSAQAVLADTRARTAGLLASARNVAISFATEGDDAPQAVSPLFFDCHTGDPGGEDAYAGRIEQLLSSGMQPDAVEDHQAPPLRGDRLSGGVNLVADQALCPFRALAHYRLHARDLDEVTPGLDPRTRGMLVHDAMKRLWDRLHGLDALQSLDESQLDAVIAECAAGALERKFADSAFQRRFLEIERERVERLLREWTAVERQRPWFRVAGTEVEMQIELGGAGFRVRADRIDELAGGGRLIIDYKTGRLVGIGVWADPRMEEPQLPMYALGIGEDAAALALAGLRRGECELRGVAADVDEVPGLKPVSELGFDDMAALRAWWASTLGALVAEYKDGVARVDPKNAQACQNCDVMPLCRIFERGGSVG